VFFDWTPLLALVHLLFFISLLVCFCSHLFHFGRLLPRSSSRFLQPPLYTTIGMVSEKPYPLRVIGHFCCPIKLCKRLFQQAGTVLRLISMSQERIVFDIAHHQIVFRYSVGTLPTTAGGIASGERSFYFQHFSRRLPPVMVSVKTFSHSASSNAFARSISFCS